jgi:hypothetical protein
MKLLACFMLLPLAMLADPVEPYPEPPIPPETTPEVWSFGSTPTALWSAAYEPSENGNGGNYYVGFEPHTTTIASFTAQFTFATASPDNSANFGVVIYFGYDSSGLIPHGTPEDPSNPNLITWDATHQVETITVPITQFNVTEQIASIEMPHGATAPPQITFLDITTGQLQSVPEPASAWLITLGILGISLIAPHGTLPKPFGV